MTQTKNFIWYRAIERGVPVDRRSQLQVRYDVASATDWRVWIALRCPIWQSINESP